MSASQPVFSKTLLDLYRLSSESPIDEFQDAALTLLKPMLPFDSAMWGTATAVRSTIDVHTLHLHKKDPAMMVEYDRVKSDDLFAARVLTVEQATGGESAVESSTPDLRDLLRRYEQNNVFITSRQDMRLRFVHWLSLFRADKDDNCRPEEIALLDCLAPHLMQSLAMNRANHLTRIGPASTVQKGSAICDFRGVVYHSDPYFDAKLRDEWDNWLGNALPNSLLEHLARESEPYQGRTMVLRRHVEHGLLFLKVRARCRADSLAPRERIVATLFGKGLSYKEIAKALDRSPATVRNQLQATYAKLEVRGVVELVSELNLAD